MEYSNLVDVTDFIRYYENVASEDFCDLLIDEFSGYVLDPDNPKIGEPLGSGRRWGVPSQFAYLHSFHIREDNEYKHLHNPVKECFDKPKKLYKTEFPRFEQHYDTDFRVQHYPVDGRMGEHVDNAEFKWTNKKTKLGHSQVSALLFLNDEYEGGDFIVAGNTYNPTQGSALFFPSNFMYPHEVKPVTKGNRWSIATWLM